MTVMGRQSQGLNPHPSDAHPNYSCQDDWGCQMVLHERLCRRMLWEGCSEEVASQGPHLFLPEPRVWRVCAVTAAM